MSCVKHKQDPTILHFDMSLRRIQNVLGIRLVQHRLEERYALGCEGKKQGAAVTFMLLILIWGQM